MFDEFIYCLTYERDAVQICYDLFRIGADETEGVLPTSSLPAFLPPIPPKKKRKINYCQRSGCDPLIYAFFLSEIHILYTDIIFVKGWPGRDSTILY